MTTILNSILCSLSNPLVAVRRAMHRRVSELGRTTKPLVALVGAAPFCVQGQAWSHTPTLVISPSVSQGTALETVCVDVRISTDGDSFAVAKCTIEYDSTVVAFQSATIGSDLAGQNFRLYINTNSSWKPVSPEVNRNVLILARGGAYDYFTGENLQMARLCFQVVSQGCETSPLNIDRRCVNSALTTYNLDTICYPHFDFTSGVVATACATDSPELRAPVIRLHQNSPNPFNPLTRIGFEIASPGFTRLEIFDATGHRVRTLVAQILAPGPHEALWNGRNDAGVALPTGAYFYRLVLGSASKSRRMLLLK
jgi:hypothetical protein